MLDPKTALAAFITITERDLIDLDRETRSRLAAIQSTVTKLLDILGPPAGPHERASIPANVPVGNIQWYTDALARIGLECAALAATCRDVGERQTLLKQLKVEPEPAKPPSTTSATSSPSR